MAITAKEREALLQSFAEQIQGFNIDQLEDVRRAFIRELNRGRYPFGDDLELNHLAAYYMGERLKELRAQDWHRDRTPEEVLKQEAARLARENSVSVKTATEFLRRQQQDSNDADSYPMRSERRPAPPAEPREEEPTAAERQRQKWGQR